MNGHTAENCFTPQCTYCNKYGHTYETCHKLLFIHTNQECQICHKKGHLANVCKARFNKN